MKKYLFPLLLLAIVACKEKNQQEPINQEAISPARAIAEKHGIDNWDKLSKLAFTFNVDRGESHYERRFIWDLEADKVTMISDGDSLTFRRNKPTDSLSLAADKSFVNDSYWLLAPYKLEWDSNTDISPARRERAPISGDSLNVITLSYGQEGGYTPGDVYDFYYDDSHTLREWTYYNGGRAEPSMITTWEEYREVGGLNLAMMHNDITQTFKIYFTDVEVD